MHGQEQSNSLNRILDSFLYSLLLPSSMLPEQSLSDMLAEHGEIIEHPTNLVESYVDNSSVEEQTLYLNKIHENSRE